MWRWAVDYLVLWALVLSFYAPVELLRIIDWYTTRVEYLAVFGIEKAVIVTGMVAQLIAVAAWAWKGFLVDR